MPSVRVSVTVRVQLPVRSAEPPTKPPKIVARLLLDSGLKWAVYGAAAELSVIDRAALSSKTVPTLLTKPLVVLTLTTPRLAWSATPAPVALPEPSVALFSRVILVPEGDISTRLNWLRCGWVMSTVTSRSPSTKPAVVMLTRAVKEVVTALSGLPLVAFGVASAMRPVLPLKV